jgi:hypothetical protein
MIGRLSILLVAAMLLGGCAPEPFPDQPSPELSRPDPDAIRQNFAASLPERFISDDSVIIQAPFHDELAVLGVLRVDRKAGTFELAALNHVGVGLFVLGGDRDSVKVVNAMPMLEDKKQVLLAIAGDIRRMFFDLVPGPDFTGKVESRKVEFSHGRLWYEFAGQPAVLREKRQEDWLGTVWRVRYYEYAADSGGLHPRGIVMDNFAFHYRIIVKNRKWQVGQP